MDLTNPLRLDLTVSDLRLATTMDGEADTSGAESADCPALSLQLPAQQTVSVELVSRPRVEGRLAVRGIRWSLGNSVACSTLFPAPAVHHAAAALSQRPSKANAQLPGTLTLSVEPPEPLLELAFEDLSPALFAGCPACWTLVMTNIGARPVGKAALCTSEPSAVWADIQTDVDGHRKAVHAIPLAEPIAEKDSVRVPLRVRFHDAGSRTVTVAVEYESAAGGPRRLAQVQARVTALPTLRCHTTFTRVLVSGEHTEALVGARGPCRGGVRSGEPRDTEAHGTAPVPPSSPAWHRPADGQ